MSTRPRLWSRLPLFQLVLMIVSVALAGATFGRVFAIEDVTAPVLLGAIVPVVAVAVSRARRCPHLVAVLAVEIVAFVVTATVVVFSATAAATVVPTSRTLASMSEGVRTGWRVILSSTVPAPARPTALFVPFALTFIAAFAGAELVCRTRRVLLVSVPVVALGVAGVLFGAHSSGSWGIELVLALVVLAALVAVRSAGFATDRRPYDRRGLDADGAPAGAGDHGAGDDVGAAGETAWALRRQRLALGVPFILVVTALAVPLGRALPFVDTDTQVSLRDHFSVPLQQERDLNPLTQIAADKDDDEVRYRLRFDAAAPPDLRVRLAVLDRFDGAQWSASGEHLTTGPELTPPAAEADGTTDPGAAATAERRSVSYAVDVVAPTGPWLPVLDRPVRLDAPADVNVQVDPVHGTLIVPGGPPAGLHYQAESQVPAYAADTIGGATVDTSQDARAAVSLHDDLPSDVAALRSQITDRASSPFMQLALLQLFFHNDPRFNTGRHFSVDPQAAPGFTMGHVARFLSADGARAGRPEEFAVAFATLARSMGMPARVVVGYSPAAPASGQSLDMKANELTAWPEVALAGFGWVPFAVLPDDQSNRTVSVAEQDLVAQVAQAGDQAANQTQAELPAGDNPNLAPAAPLPPVEDGSKPRYLTIFLALTLIVAGGVAVGPWVRKRRRRARRRAARDPAEQVANAWLEALDRLTESGEAEVTALTTRQAFSAARDRFGLEVARSLLDLGRLHDTALHDRTPPPPAWGDQAWQLVDDFCGGVRASQTHRRRWRAAMDRRPLQPLLLLPVGAASAVGARQVRAPASTAPPAGATRRRGRDRGGPAPDDGPAAAAAGPGSGGTAAPEGVDGGTAPVTGAVPVTGAGRPEARVSS